MATPQAANDSPLRLGTVHDLVREHPGFSEAAVRALIHKGRFNGLDAYVHRIGRRVMIDLDGFQRWVRDTK